MQKSCKIFPLLRYLLFILIAVFLLLGFQILLPPALSLPRMRFTPRNTLSLLDSTLASDPAHQFWLIRYLRWHDAHRHSPRTRRVVFRTIGTGLGDHIVSAICVFRYAVLSRRLFLIEWNRPYPIRLILSATARRRFVYQPAIDRNDSFGGQHFSFRFRVPLPRDMIDLLNGNITTVYLRAGPLLMQPNTTALVSTVHWPNTTIPPFNLNVRRSVTRTLLDPSRKLSEVVSSLKSAFRLCAADERCTPWRYVPHFRWWPFRERKRYIAVHARLGIGTKETRISRFSKIPGNERKIAHCLAGYVKYLAISSGEKAPVVFIATDTEHFRPIFRRAMLERMSKSRVVYMRSKVRHWNRIPRSSKRGLQMYFEQHAEMLLIGHATHIVSFWSGFSRCGFWRGSAKRLKVVTYKNCGV